MGSQTQASNTPDEIRDLWETPAYLYSFADKKFNFTGDVAASDVNHRHSRYLTKEDDSLSCDWLKFSKGGYLWCNPPYSEPGLWLKKAWEEAQRGTKIVLLVPTINGENYYRDYVLGKCRSYITINGRIAFVAAESYIKPGKKGKPDIQVIKGEEIDGNTRGSCFIVYNGSMESNVVHMEWVDRDELKQRYLEAQ